MSTVCHVPGASSRARLLSLARRRGTLTRQQVEDAGIHSQTLSRLVRAGELERVGRGRYRLPDRPQSAHDGLLLVAAAVPRAVFCLLSALSFHEIGTQLPHEVWIAIDRRSRPPALSYPPLRVQLFSGKALTEGVESHRVDGQTLRVYGVAKTIADLFKYRNKLGVDVALEALREAWRRKLFTMDEIHRYARVCRVERVMRPYLESLVA